MIRSGYALFPSLLFSAGCPAGKPSEQLVKRIEARLATDPCLKNIANMRRTYSYAHRGWKIDPNRVDVDVQLAGFDGLPAGRFIINPPKTVRIDDRERFGASATYVVNIDTLDIWACGGTWTGLRHDPLY
jgi:hypothetical protein